MRHPRLHNVLANTFYHPNDIAKWISQIARQKWEIARIPYTLAHCFHSICNKSTPLKYFPGENALIGSLYSLFLAVALIAF